MGLPDACVTLPGIPSKAFAASSSNAFSVDVVDLPEWLLVIAVAAVPPPALISIPPL